MAYEEFIDGKRLDAIVEAVRSCRNELVVVAVNNVEQLEVQRNIKTNLQVFNHFK